MRYKPEHKQETRQRIIKKASEEFRTRGFEGIGIAGLMAALNLTHGGFYAHFADKEDLVGEACALMLDERLTTMLSILETGDGFAAIIDYYLSEEHRDQPDTGCLLPALSAEVARHSSPSRQTFTRKLSQTFAALAEHMPGQTLVQKRAHIYVMFAALVGAVSLARAVSDPTLSKALLDSTREHLLGLIGSD